MCNYLKFRIHLKCQFLALNWGGAVTKLQTQRWLAASPLLYPAEYLRCEKFCRKISVTFDFPTEIFAIVFLLTENFADRNFNQVCTHDMHTQYTQFNK